MKGTPLPEIPPRRDLEDPRETRDPKLRGVRSALAAFALTVGLAAAAAGAATEPPEPPWREAGLTEREAAAHALDRFAYGARPGDVDRVVDLGVREWFAAQLAASLPETRLEGELSQLPAAALSAEEIAATYPNPPAILFQAVREGVVSEEEVRRVRAARSEIDGSEGEASEGDERARSAMGALTERSKLVAWARELGFRPQRELRAALLAQKVYRAVYAENQLAEVLTDFWFNHFNVSLTDNQARVHVLAYERDAIRPHVLGSFRALLGATARHPAMLLYLDNARSTAEEGQPTTFDRERFAARRGRRTWGSGLGGAPGRGSRAERLRAGDAERLRRAGIDRPDGLNENYARELLELHTLGVGGGYTQQDVVEVARAFTGWSVMPPGAERRRVERLLELSRRFGAPGFRAEGGFLFRADVHDAGEKTVLGRRLPAGRGIDDGEEVLDLVARHPETARHLAEKLAVRFVSDAPPQALVERLAAAFLAAGGDLRAMMEALFESPELWAPGARRQKIKSPFELAVSSLRALGAEVAETGEVAEWVARMGQPLYAYQAPTGFPDSGRAWVNTGALVERMSFGLELASGGVGGVSFDLAALAGGREPASLTEALGVYVPLLLPERDPKPIIARLEPLVHDPDLTARFLDGRDAEDAEDGFGRDARAESLFFGPPRRRAQPARRVIRQEPPTALELAVGVILGSPEIQRR